jgi:hypothetical protein
VRATGRSTEAPRLGASVGFCLLAHVAQQSRPTKGGAAFALVISWLTRSFHLNRLTADWSAQGP